MTATVDQGFAAWLKAGAYTLTATPADAGRWGEGSSVASRSPFATVAGARAEADRLAAFFGRPIVRDRAVVDGRARRLIGRCIRLVSDDLGYGAPGRVVLVVGVAEQDNNTSVLTILRRLS